MNEQMNVRKQPYALNSENACTSCQLLAWNPESESTESSFFVYAASISGFYLKPISEVTWSDRRGTAEVTKYQPPMQTSHPASRTAMVPDSVTHRCIPGHARMLSAHVGRVFSARCTRPLDNSAPMSM